MRYDCGLKIRTHLAIPNQSDMDIRYIPDRICKRVDQNHWSLLLNKAPYGHQAQRPLRHRSRLGKARRLNAAMHNLDPSQDPKDAQRLN